MREPGILAYRFDGPLFFANAQLLADDIEAALAVTDGATDRWVVIDAEGVSDLDTTGVGVLDDLRIALEGRGIALVLARVKAPIRAYLERSGFLDRLGGQNIFLEVDDAVAAGQRALGRRTIDGQEASPAATT